MSVTFHEESQYDPVVKDAQNVYLETHTYTQKRKKRPDDLTEFN